jgi:hypothetical protein
MNSLVLALLLVLPGTHTIHQPAYSLGIALFVSGTTVF